MRKFIIIPLLFLVGCITIKPECPCKITPIVKIDSVETEYINPFIISYSDTFTLKYLDYNRDGRLFDTSLYSELIFKDTITPEPIWDFNVVDTSYEAIDDSIVIYQFRYRIIPVEKEIQL